MLKVGEVFEGKVRGLTSSGQGVVQHASGRVVFIAGIWLDERARIKVTGLKGRIAFGELVELVETSPDRVAPVCKYHGVTDQHCGGCAWMFVSETAQLEAKQQRIQSTLERIIPNLHINPIWPSEKSFTYRNRVQFKSNGQHLGFVANQTNRLIDVDTCAVLSEKNQITLKEMRERLPEPTWRPASKKNKWVTLDINEGINANIVSVNQRLPFQQANTLQNNRMRLWLAEHLTQLSHRKKALELFCGSGNFTSILCDADFNQIVATEGVVTAIEDLKSKEYSNVNAVVVDLFNGDAFSALIKAHADADVLLLNPPRDGLKQKEGLFNRKNNLKHVFYISCDLATFARDLSVFVENGYVVKDLQPVDQFPQTPHVEILCYFYKK